jgi:hypothetical protein
MKLRRGWRYFYPAQPKRVYEGPFVDKLCKDPDYIAELKKNGWQWNLVRKEDGRYEAWTRHKTRSTIPVDRYVKDLDRLEWKGLCEVRLEILDRRTTDVKEKLLFFDVKIWNGELLSDKTFAERRQILEKMFEKIPTKYDWYFKGHKEADVLQLSIIWGSKEFPRDFKKLYEEEVENNHSQKDRSLNEGLVLKKLSGKLEYSASGPVDSKVDFKWKIKEDHMRADGGK